MARIAALSSSTLIERLVHLARKERGVQAAFLVHLDEFDRRRGYLEAGHDSLWNWCVRVLHLSEGAAGRRIAAMRIIRRFPQLLDAVRDGRLSLSTVALLGQVLTPENVDDLVARAAYRSRADVDHLVASIRPRHAPKDGIRRIVSGGRPSGIMQPSTTSQPVTISAALVTGGAPATAPRTVEAGSPPSSSAAASRSGTARTAAAPPSSISGATDRAGPRADDVSLPEPSRSRADLRPISQDEWSVRITIDAQCRRELETLRQLLSHKCGHDLAAVLREAIRCAIEKHGKRRGAVHPSRAPAPARGARATNAPRNPAAPPRDTAAPAPPRVASDPVTLSGQRERDPIPAEVRRIVYDRDGGSCSYVSPDGQRCGSKWKLEFDHILPAFLGGPSTSDNLRLRCRAHNFHHAEQVFGMEHMERFRRRYAVEGYG